MQVSRNIVNGPKGNN